MANYHRLVRVARGEEPADLVFRGGQVVDVLTRSVYSATVGICEDTIAYVAAPDDPLCEGHTVVDATGMVIAPGLIDSHMHIESTHATPEYFADAVLPRGVTTVAQDPHEMANVLGIEGVDYMRQASRGLPLRVLTFVPTCVPAVPGLETSGASFTATEVGHLLDGPDTIGLAEVMDYWGVVRQTPRVTDIVKLGRERGVIMTGHVRFAEDRDLNAYLAAGIESDHGLLTADRMAARVRMGMVVEVCCAPDRDNVAEWVELWRRMGSLDNVVLVTDDVSPGDFVAEGHLDFGVRRAVELGMDPVDAIRAATVLPARRLRRHDLGVVAPGYLADMVVLRDLGAFTVHLTVTNGRIVAHDGRMVMPSRPGAPVPEAALASVRLPELRAEDFAVRAAADRHAAGDRVAARVLTGQGRGLETRCLPVADGVVEWQRFDDLALVAVLHRHGRNTNRGLVLIAGTGLRSGALATTYAHDSHNLLIVGRSPEEMAVAANALRASGGGYVAVEGGVLKALAALPVAGILAPRPVEALAAEFDAFVAAARQLGVAGNPIRLLTSLPLPVVPSFRPTDMGLVDVDRQVLIPAFEAGPCDLEL